MEHLSVRQFRCFHPMDTEASMAGGVRDGEVVDMTKPNSHLVQPIRRGVYSSFVAAGDGDCHLFLASDLASARR